MGCSAIVTLMTSTVLADRKRLDVGMLLLHSNPWEVSEAIDLIKQKDIAKPGFHKFQKTIRGLTVFSAGNFHITQEHSISWLSTVWQMLLVWHWLSTG